MKKKKCFLSVITRHFGVVSSPVLVVSVPCPFRIWDMQLGLGDLWAGDLTRGKLLVTVTCYWGPTIDQLEGWQDTKTLLYHLDTPRYDQSGGPRDVVGEIANDISQFWARLPKE